MAESGPFNAESGTSVNNAATPGKSAERGQGIVLSRPGLALQKVDWMRHAARIAMAEAVKEWREAKKQRG